MSRYCTGFIWDFSGLLGLITMGCAWESEWLLAIHQKPLSDSCPEARLGDLFRGSSRLTVSGRGIGVGALQFVVAFACLKGFNSVDVLAFLWYYACYNFYRIKRFWLIERSSLSARSITE